MGRKVKQEPVKLTVTIEDINGNVVKEEDLKNMVSCNELYYKKMRIIIKKYGFDVV